MHIYLVIPKSFSIGQWFHMSLSDFMLIILNFQDKWEISALIHIIVSSKYEYLFRTDLTTCRILEQSLEVLQIILIQVGINNLPCIRQCIVSFNG